MEAAAAAAAVPSVRSVNFSIVAPTVRCESTMTVTTAQPPVAVNE